MPVRILIADDNPHFRKVLKSALSGHRDWVVCGDAPDGLEAVSMAVTLRPDVILLDLQMPWMNGLESAREILRVHPSLPIILFTLFTAHESAPFQEEAAKGGIRKVICKGEINSLLDAVEEVLGLRISSEVAARPPHGDAQTESEND